MCGSQATGERTHTAARVPAVEKPREGKPCRKETLVAECFLAEREH